MTTSTDTSTDTSTELDSRRADHLRSLEQEVGVLIRRVRRVIGERARAVHETFISTQIFNFR